MNGVGSAVGIGIKLEEGELNSIVDTLEHRGEDHCTACCLNVTWREVCVYD